MKLKTFLAVLAAVLFVHSASAQDKRAKPDLSGVWQLDADKSKDVLDVFKKKPKKGDPVTKTTDTLTIRHVDPALEFFEKVVTENFDSTGRFLNKTEKIPFNCIYYTDKRGEKNRWGSKELESESKWDGKNIIIVTTIDKERQELAIMKISVDKAGSELTVVTSTGSMTFDSVRPGKYFAGYPTSIKLYRRVQ